MGLSEPKWPEELGRLGDDRHRNAALARRVQEVRPDLELHQEDTARPHAVERTAQAQERVKQLADNELLQRRGVLVGDEAHPLGELRSWGRKGGWDERIGSWLVGWSVGALSTSTGPQDTLSNKTRKDGNCA